MLGHSLFRNEYTIIEKIDVKNQNTNYFAFMFDELKENENSFILLYHVHLDKYVIICSHILVNTIFKIC